MTVLLHPHAFVEGHVQHGGGFVKTLTKGLNHTRRILVPMALTGHTLLSLLAPQFTTPQSQKLANYGTAASILGLLS